MNKQHRLFSYGWYMHKQREREREKDVVVSFTLKNYKLFSLKILIKRNRKSEKNANRAQNMYAQVVD